MSDSLTQLAALGAAYRDPLQAIDWQAADPARPWLPPELLSLAGLPSQRDMAPETLRRFSRIEFARLCAAGLWLEGLMINRTSQDSYLQQPLAEARVVLQEVREEAGHGLMFLEMIDRAGLDGVPLLGGTQLLSWVARRLKPDSAEFWAMVYLGESVTDNLALRALRLDPDAICPLARQVLLQHHKDEARHIAAARTLLKRRLGALTPLRRRVLSQTLEWLLPLFLKATFYPTPASLQALGLADPVSVARQAAACPQRRALAEACAAPARKFLRSCLADPDPKARKTMDQGQNTLALHGETAPRSGPNDKRAKDKMPVFISSDIYRQAAYGSNHPLTIPRVETVMELCDILRWLDRDDLKESPQATPEQLAQFHDRDYIDTLRRVASLGRADRESRERYGLGTLENPIFPGLYERASTSVGGSILAAELAMEGRVAYHPAGGTHHGRPDRASGFCYFNDPVIAILTLLDGGLKRVFYVDLDAHFGDGVQDAFADDDRVFTVSIHEEGRWPYAGPVDDRAGGAARNLPVPKGFNDSELGFLMREAVLPLGERFAPEAVVITCGADGLAGDPLSGMELSNAGLWRAVEQLVMLAPATVVLGGGGYNPWTVARCWTGLWGRLCGLNTAAALPAAAQALLRGLECDLVDEEDVPDAWHLSLEDAPNPGPVRPEIQALVPIVLAP